MMGCLPFWVYDGPFPDFDDAVASDEPKRFCRFNEIDVCPLITMVVNVISHFAQKDAFRPQYLESLFQKQRVSI